jgi:hypothetical protein
MKMKKVSQDKGNDWKHQSNEKAKMMMIRRMKIISKDEGNDRNIATIKILWWKWLGKWVEITRGKWWQGATQ